jgi:tRNA (cmo5U34)-methyltransferase
LDLGAGTGLLSAAIAGRIAEVNLLLLDASEEMLEKAEQRLARFQPKIMVQTLNQALPCGPFDAIVSALAIHHLDDQSKRTLYGRILSELVPSGIFINAEQVSAPTDRLQRLFEATHLELARSLGSSEAEIRGAIERMKADQCSPLADQLRWLEQVGFEEVECFYRWFRFSVFGGWKPLPV